MSANSYECMFILDANAYARDPSGAANTIKQLIEKSDGKVLASRLWNEQKLAYPIRGRHKGAYWLSYFEMPGAKITEFNRACQLTDMIMRHQVIKIDPRLIDQMVAAAKGEVKPEAGTDSSTEDGKDNEDGAEKNEESKATETADAS